MRSPIISRIAATSLALAFVAAGSLISTPANAAQLQDTTTGASYNSAGTYAYTVPENVYELRLRALGAAGGSTCVAGGSGANVSGSIAVRPGDIVDITVGGAGGVAMLARGEHFAIGGFNGGGSSMVHTNLREKPISVAGGGGSTVISINGTEVLVAGGGGGAGGCRTTSGGMGGTDSSGNSGQDVERYGPTIDLRSLPGGLGGERGRMPSAAGADALEGGGGGAGKNGGNGGGLGDYSGQRQAGGGGGGAGSSWASPDVAAAKVVAGYNLGAGSAFIELMSTSHRS